MEQKQKRISFDVPAEIHTILKIRCAREDIALRDLMKEIALKTAEEYQKKELHDLLLQGFHDSYEGKGKVLSDEDLDRWEKIINES